MFLSLRLLLVGCFALQVLVLMAGLLPDAETAVAVMGLSTQLSLLPWMFCYSLGTATATRVAQALGGGSELRASRILRWAQQKNFAHSMLAHSMHMWQM
jgi:MATE family multidrug resistance protein